jgi:perosamine synthetase
MPDMDKIRAVARRHNIFIIEDAAEALGAEYKDKKAGSFGDTGVFSFHGSKTVTTGEGGMLVTNREDLFHRIQVLRDHGRQPGDRMFWNTEIAYKYKMSSMQAALGLAQIERIDELLERKRQQFEWYQNELADLEDTSMNIEPKDVRSTFWMVTLVLDPGLGINKIQFMERLSQNGIDSRPFFHPLSSIPAYEDSEQASLARFRNNVAYRISPYGINLPSALNLTKEDIQEICRIVKQCLER